MKKLVILLSIMLFSTAAAKAQTWAVALNLGDAIELGTIGIEGSAAVAQHWSIHAGAKVNPWTFAKHDTWNGLFSEPDPNQKQDRKQSYAIGARWWPWNVYSGWWVGCKAQYQEYNRGGFLTKTAEEGDAFGAALSGGYSLMLKEHFNLDFGLGVWGGWTKYRQFEYPENGKIIAEGNKWFFLPNEVIISLVYIF
ncbi:MAG: DUF3575 domain-containing protein [Bacteroidales bacterium]|nr:DUF3575 domain-containing protein [Bacteroidales bacterium]